MIKPAQLSLQPQDTEDDALIRRVADGDREAFETLYQRYAPRLRRYLYAQLGQTEIAEEVCHDVMLIVWQSAGCFQHALTPFDLALRHRLARS